MVSYLQIFNVFTFFCKNYFSIEFNSIYLANQIEKKIDFLHVVQEIWNVAYMKHHAVGV